VSSSAAAGFEQRDGTSEQVFVLHVECLVANDGDDGPVTVEITLYGAESSTKTETIVIGSGEESTVDVVFDDPSLVEGLVRFECHARA